jgi:hypothetical protein
VGTLYNYPPRGDVTALLAGYPAPTSLGTQMFAQGTICKIFALSIRKVRYLKSCSPIIGVPDNHPILPDFCDVEPVCIK